MDNPVETGTIGILCTAVGAGLAKLIDYFRDSRNQQNDRETSLIADMQERIDQLEAARAESEKELRARLNVVEKDRDECRRESVQTAKELGELKGKVAALTRTVETVKP